MHRGEPMQVRGGSCSRSRITPSERQLLAPRLQGIRSRSTSLGICLDLNARNRSDRDGLSWASLG